MYPNINFNFNELDVKSSKYDPDILVAIACAIIFIFTIIFVLIPEKNVEITGNNLQQFDYSLNKEWLDDSMIKADNINTRIEKANSLMGKESIKDKMQFLILVNSIATDQKTIKKEYLNQIISDRAIILSYLIVLFKDTNKTEFSCFLAQCKDKEYKAKQQKFQTIKFMNLQLDNYYQNLINIQKHKKERHLFFEKVPFDITKALTENEQEHYKQMQ